MKNTQKFWGRDKVFVIAEAGSNWRVGSRQKDIDMGKRLIDVAVEAKADAVKFQTYKPETVYVANAGGSNYLERQGHNKDIFEIFKDLSMPYEFVEIFARHCEERGVLFMSTPFSIDDFNVIDPHTAVHKIASYEISHKHLIIAAAQSQKPLVVSTGASVEGDIQWAVDTFTQHGGTEICLLQCTAKYPAPFCSMNLKAIPWLSQRFDLPSGLSDHSRHPTRAPIAAVALGARVIEKHYTTDNNLPGPDNSFAVLPDELKDMVQAIRDTEDMLGTGVKEVLDDERELAAFARRGLQATKDIKVGDVLKENENYAILRPGNRRLGIHPRMIDSLEGKMAAEEISEGDGLTPQSWTHE